MEYLLSLLLMGAIAALTLFVFRVVSLGRKCKAEGHQHKWKHRRAVNHALLAVAALVVLIEAFSFFSDGKEPSNAMLSVHLLFTIPFLILLLVLRFWITGEKRPLWHGPIAYTAAILFAGVLTTGLRMYSVMLSTS